MHQGMDESRKLKGHGPMLRERMKRNASSVNHKVYPGGVHIFFL